MSQVRIPRLEKWTSNYYFNNNLKSSPDEKIFVKNFVVIDDWLNKNTD